MFCPQCGSENQENTKFCGKCGTALGGATSTANKHNQPKEMKASEIGKAASNIKSELTKWISKYLSIWQKYGTLEKKEKNLWLGIHGGIFLLLFCVFFVPLLGSGGSRSRANIKKMLEDAAADGEISEDDIISLAQAISDYEDMQKVEEIYADNLENNFENMVEISGFLNLTSQLSTECRNQSGLSELMNQYDAWHDRDGLTEKIYERPDQVKYIFFSIYGDMLPIGNNDDSFREEYNGCIVDVEWFAYADSNEITFVKTISKEASQEVRTERYDGQYEVSGTEILVTLDGKEYCISEADTDLEAMRAESFAAVSKGNWGYTEEFYNMIASYLGDWEDFNNSGNEKPLYITFNGMPGNQLIVMGGDGVYLKRLKGFSVEQGEGKTATFSSGKGSVQVSYDKSGNNLIITVNGTDYELSSTAIANTGTYDDFGGRN